MIAPIFTILWKYPWGEVLAPVADSRNYSAAVFLRIKSFSQVGLGNEPVNRRVVRFY